jgi:hypothetical protein
VGGRCVDEDDGAEEGDDKEGEGNSEDEDSFFPCGDIGVLFVDFGGLGVAREEDEEEEHAVKMLVLAVVDSGGGTYMKKKHDHCTPT